MWTRGEMTNDSRYPKIVWMSDVYGPLSVSVREEEAPPTTAGKMIRWGKSSAILQIKVHRHIQHRLCNKQLKTLPADEV